MDFRNDTILNQLIIYFLYPIIYSAQSEQQNEEENNHHFSLISRPTLQLRGEILKNYISLIRTLI